MSVLADTDLDRLNPDDHVVIIRAYQRLISHLQAGLYRSMLAILDAYRHLVDDPDDEEFVHDAAQAEIGSALGLTRRAAAQELAFAIGLRRVPQVAAALAKGDIDRRRARVLILETAHLSEDAARQTVSQVIGSAGSLTTGQLAARLRRLVVEAAPEEAQQRFDHATDQRRMVVEPTCEGTADILLIGVSPEKAMAASDHVDTLARHLKRLPGESRTLDQLRTDVAVDLLRGRNPDPSRAANPRSGEVIVQVDLTTLAELDDHPGELAGYGPVIADIARQVARSTTRWSFEVSDPDCGRVTHVGAVRRRPTTAQTRMVRAGHPTCVFPGCRMPAHRCDLDHRQPYSRNGATCPCNLAPLCRHHHQIRHRAGWTYRRIDQTAYEWTSPLGRTYPVTCRSP
jgi:hypothetical protein